MNLATAAIAAAGTAWGIGGPAAMAQRGRAAPAPAAAPRLFTGRSFAGVTIGAAAQRGDIRLAAARVTAWSEEGAGEGAGEGGAATGRLLLSGDVQVDLGVYRFTAARAVVWLEPVELSPQDAAAFAPSPAPTPTLPAPPAPAPADLVGPPSPTREPEAPARAYQVAVYFDRVGDPTGEAGVSQTADRLLTTGILVGSLDLKADVLATGRTDDPLVLEAEGRLVRFLRLASGAGGDDDGSPPTAIAVGPQTGPMVPGLGRPYEPESPLTREDVRPGTRVPLGGAGPRRPGARAGGAAPEPGAGGDAAGGERAGGQPADPPYPPAPGQLPPIFSPAGTITFAGGEPTLVTGPEEAALVVTGGVVVQYTDPGGGKNLQISAERLVAFLKPGKLTDLFRHTGDAVRGIYLEGDVVATDGNYTLRGPRVFYDVTANRAIVLDAVFWTYDQRRGLPLYVRGKVLRQEARNQFSAETAALANTSFFEPSFSIGATSMTVTRREDPDAPGRPGTYIDAQNLTMRLGGAEGLPVFWWPRFVGDVENLPLKEVRAESSSGSGFAIKTAWDIFGIIGEEAPRGIAANLLLDGYFDRGFAAGADLAWDRVWGRGSALLWGLFNDTGRDSLSTGSRIERDGETRGLLIGEDVTHLDENWTLFLEGSYISDPAFIDAFYRPLAQERREFTNAAYLRYLEDNSEFTLLVKGAVDDFTPNQYLLQSLGYTVDKLPEVGYFRRADDLLTESAPGRLTLSSDTRLSRMRLNFTEPRLREFGFDTPIRSRSTFGLEPGDRLSDALRGRGYTQDYADRFDTRHELVGTADFGPLKVSPFLVGRFTGYDTDFKGLNPSQEQDYRVYYALGTAFSTTVQHVDDSAESSLFDVHRVRHIVEPSATVWYAGTDLRQTQLPVYDDEVESLANASAVRAGVTQTWQTQRGGPGQWRSVDFLKVRTDVVLASRDLDKESPVGHFFDYRPEYSLLGNYFQGDVQWQATDAVALIFNTVQDFDTGQPERTVAGGRFEHSPDLTSWAEARYLNARDITVVGAGADYRLTRKYTLSGNVTYDTDIDKVQSVGLSVRRRFPEATLGVVVSYDNIASETTFGVIFEPLGLTDRTSQLQRLDRAGSARGLGL